MTDNILQYESEIWATADLLRGCGIKESEWPSYMMPFFALIMIESRLIRLYEKELQAFGGKAVQRHGDRSQTISACFSALPLGYFPGTIGQLMIEAT